MVPGALRLICADASSMRSAARRVAVGRRFGSATACPAKPFGGDRGSGRVEGYAPLILLWEPAGIQRRRPTGRRQIGSPACAAPMTLFTASSSKAPTTVVPRPRATA